MKNLNQSNEFSESLKVIQDEMRKSKPSSRSGMRSGNTSKKVLEVTDNRNLNSDIKTQITNFKVGSKLPSAKHIIADTNYLVEKRLAEIKSKYKHDKITEKNNQKLLNYTPVEKDVHNSKDYSKSIDFSNKENKNISKTNSISQPISQSIPIDNNFTYEEISLSDDQKEMQRILDSVNMGDYLSLLIENGFDDLDTFLELNVDHMQTLNIPLGYRIKLDKAIRIAKGEDVGPKAVTNIQYEELSFDHAEVDKRIYSESSEVAEQRIIEKVDGGTQDGAERVIIIKNTKFNPELDGEYDEERNEREFAEALQAVRGQSEVMEPVKREVKLGKKYSCYNCFKVVMEEKVLKYFDKHLCSEECVQVVEKEGSKECAQCLTRNLKINLFFLEGKWVCSDACRQKLEVSKVHDEIQEGTAILQKSQELNQDLERLKKMQLEIEYLKKKNNMTVDINIDLSRFNQDYFDPYK